MIGTHYSFGQAPSKMWDAAAIIGQLIRQYSEDNDEIPALCYTGMSGIATATAISLWLNMNYPDFQFYMIYVRKEGEESHGQPIEHNFPYLDNGNREQFAGCKFFLAFVDDLICSGKTRERVYTEIEKHTTHLPSLIERVTGNVSRRSYCTEDV